METTLETNTNIAPLLKKKQFAWLLIITSAILMSIDNFLKMPMLIGGWHIVMYILLLMPLIYLAWKKELKNRYTKWFIPFLLVMIVDMFYYNNEMVQFFLPVIFYFMIGLLTITSMHTVQNLYQTLLPKFSLRLRAILYVKEFLEGIITYKTDKTLYSRIGIALLITVPFLGVFMALLTEADSYYSNTMKNLFTFNTDIELYYFITMPLYFFIYLFVFIYGFSNQALRVEQSETKKLDFLIVGIFLSMINLLFATFVVMQIPFLTHSNFSLQGMNIADFAREGFFQLMMVMGLVSLIFLFILRRYKDEKGIQYMLIGLLFQSIIMGFVSLKKMHLYQSIKGATVLRYYVEWFDYFLLIVLMLGIIFLIRKYSFTKLLNVITLLGIISFTIIVSLNIDAMVAEHNIKKFKNTPKTLDKTALSSLSIDALPIIKKYKIILPEHNDVHNWYEDYNRVNCNTFKTYHYGYCSILKKYGK